MQKVKKETKKEVPSLKKERIYFKKTVEQRITIVCSDCGGD